MDYWGKRKEIVVPVNDIMPLSEIPINFIGHYIYKPFQLYSGGKRLKLSSMPGAIVDEEKLNKILLP